MRTTALPADVANHTRAHIGIARKCRFHKIREEAASRKNNLLAGGNHSEFELLLTKGELSQGSQMQNNNLEQLTVDSQNVMGALYVQILL